MSKPTHKTLDRLYTQWGWSLGKIAQHYGVTKSTVWRWMDDAGIERRKPGRASQAPPKDELHQMYIVQRMSVAQLAECYQVTDETVRHWLHEQGLDRLRALVRESRAAALNRRDGVQRVASEYKLPEVFFFRRKE